MQTTYDSEMVDVASLSDIGNVRAQNQDEYFDSRDSVPGKRLLLVADGMGGHQGGEVASRIAVDCVGRAFESYTDSDPDEFLLRAFSEANRMIFERASEDASLAGMGATAVALLLVRGHQPCIAHAGDSRAYRLRGRKLKQLTMDHSTVGDLVRRRILSPEAARIHPQKNEVLRALGTRPTIDVEITFADAAPGDRFLLCSDGLSDMLPAEKVASALAHGGAEQAAQRLINLANLAGGEDNMTAQVLVLLPDMR